MASYRCLIGRKAAEDTQVGRMAAKAAAAAAADAAADAVKEDVENRFRNLKECYQAEWDLYYATVERVITRKGADQGN